MSQDKAHNKSYKKTQNGLSQKSKAFFTFMIFALFMQSIGAFFYFDYFADSALGKVIYLITKSLLLLLPLIFWKLFAGEIKGKTAKLKTSLLWGLILGIFSFFFIYLFYWLSPGLIQDVSPDIISKVQELGIQDYFIPMAIFLSFAHSLLEEFYWRWFVFRGLRLKMHYRWAAIISSTAFAGHHFIVLKEMFPIWVTLLFGVSVGVGGYIWCEIYQRTGSLKGAWLAHAMADIAIMSLGYLMITG